MNMDPESQADAATPLKPKVLLFRQSTTILRGREPKSGAAAGCFAVCCSLFFALILLALVNCVSIACIVIGIIYLDEANCPADPHLAPVLIASGSLAIFLSIFEGRSRVQTAKDDTTTETAADRGCYYFLTLVRLVKLGVFIYFCIIVFRLAPIVHFEPTVADVVVGGTTAVNYCNATLFLFSYWLIICIFIFSCIIISFCCCFVCFACLVGAAAASS